MAAEKAVRYEDTSYKVKKNSWEAITIIKEYVLSI